MPYTIRDITKAEITALKPLWEELNRLHLEDSVYFKDHYASFTFEKRMATLLAHDPDDTRITVAFSGTEPVGYCISTILGANGEIESLCLAACARGEGLGRRLVESHVAWMQERGCEKIRVSVSHGHYSALGFYRKLGFRDRLMVLELKDQTARDEGE